MMVNESLPESAKAGRRQQSVGGVIDIPQIPTAFTAYQVASKGSRLDARMFSFSDASEENDDR